MGVASSQPSKSNCCCSQREARKKNLPYFFNCEEVALLASTCIKGHVLTVLLLSVAVAMAAITAMSPGWHPRI